MAKYIYVGNLPVKAEPGDLQDFCSKHGEVTDVKVKGDRAMITMTSGAEAAGKALTSHKIGGNSLSIVINHEEQDFLP